MSLRKTKTDRVDARTIAAMLMSDVDLKSYTDTSYHNEELKSLTRYRFDKVCERAKLKQSVSRLVTILFPELEKLVPTLHTASVYALLLEFPGANQVASAHLTRLTNLLCDASKGRYGREMATTFRDTARRSIGSVMPAKSLELQHTIRELDAEIKDIEAAIWSMIDKMQSPITSIPGIGVRMGTMILAVIGDFAASTHRIRSSHMPECRPLPTSPDSFHCSEPTYTWKSEVPAICATRFYNTTQYVCLWDPTFAAYLAKKRAEGKHYNVALSRGKKVGSADLRFGEIRTTIQHCCITAFLSYAYLGAQPDVCFALPFLIRLYFSPFHAFQA